MIENHGKNGQKQGPNTDSIRVLAPEVRLIACALFSNPSLFPDHWAEETVIKKAIQLNRDLLDALKLVPAATGAKGN